MERTGTDTLHELFYGHPEKQSGVLYSLALCRAECKAFSPTFSISADGGKTGTFPHHILGYLRLDDGKSYDYNIAYFCERRTFRWGKAARKGTGNSV